MEQCYVTLKVPETRGSRNLSRCWKSETDSACSGSSLIKKMLMSFPAKISNLVAAESNATVPIRWDQAIIKRYFSLTSAGRKWLSATAGSVTQKIFKYTREWDNRTSASRLLRGPGCPTSTLNNKAGASNQHTGNELTRSWTLARAQNVSIRLLPVRGISCSLVLVCWELVGTRKPAVKLGTVFTHTEKN